MSFRFTITRKIGAGFGLFIAVVGIVFFLTNSTLNESREINRQINEVYTPSLRSLEELNHHLTRSLSFMKQWAYIQSREDEREKLEVVTLCTFDIPQELRTLDSLSRNWDKEEQLMYQSVSEDVHDLLNYYSKVRRYLPDFSAYDDPQMRMSAEFLFEEGEGINKHYDRASEILNRLIEEQEDKVGSVSANMIQSFDKLRLYLGNISILVIIAGLLIAYFTSRSIIRPVDRLKTVLFYLGRGIYPKKSMDISNDEIGDMAFALNRLVDGLERTREFASKVGKGDFDARYQPLSDEDELGHTLLKMRDDLAITERELEQKVQERTDEVVRQKEEIERQRNRVTELYKDLMSSITYAKRLQNTILPSDAMIRSMFRKSFVMYKPKDVVSGDFYWFKEAGVKHIFAAIDCTGHGVPGAFMSLVGYNVLNQVTKVFTTPSSILNNLNRLSAEALRFSLDGNIESRDGMDLALCTFDKETLTLEYAGAFNPVWIFRNGELTSLEPDKFAIGSFKYGEKEYNNHSVQLEKGDRVYVFSDGYQDQFGGPRGKKFMKKKFRELLTTLQEYDMDEQLSRLEAELTEWQGNHEQVDDILVIGVEIE